MKGGYSCAFSTCKNIIGRVKDISFFRFPKDLERAKLWVEACGRQDLTNKTCEELYKNYRVCALHFSQEMFLNDLRNRLQANAIPTEKHNTQKEHNTKSNFPSEVDVSLFGHIQPNTSSDVLNTEQPNTLSDVLNTEQPNTSSYVLNTEKQRERENKKIQTDLILSRSPYEEKLERRIAMLHSKINWLLKKKKNTDMNKEVQIYQESMEHYFKLTDHFLSGPIAKFVKNQVLLHRQKKKGLH